MTWDLIIIIKSFNECDQVESWRDTTGTSLCFLSMALRALSRNCSALVYSLENNLDIAQNNILNTDPIHGLNTGLLCYNSQ